MMKINYQKNILTLEWSNKRWFFTREAMSAGVLGLFYLAGVIGLSSSLRDAFLLVTPLNLLLSLAVILYNHENWTVKFILTSVIIALIGFFVEVLGVQTGIIFGDYEYGNVLGWKVFGVPLILGVNWLILIYASGMVINHFWRRFPIPFKAFLAAGLMVGLDVLIEPVAMELGFWNWEGGIVPLQNYLGWFVTAYILQLILFYSEPKEATNHVATILYWLQVFFFGLLWVF